MHACLQTVLTADPLEGFDGKRLERPAAGRRHKLHPAAKRWMNADAEHDETLVDRGR